MSIQTSYSITHAPAYLGGRADSGPYQADAVLNKSGVDLGFGMAVVLDTTSARLTPLGPNTYTPAKLPSAATDRVLGVLLHDQAAAANATGATTGTADGNMGSVLKRGKVYVWTEQDVDPSSPVYLRYSANGAGKAVGQFRKDRDGVAQVSTYTPTAGEHSKGFAVRISFADRDYTFSCISDGTMTAQEVCDALRLAMASDAEFTARAVATGTTTLILTGQVAGEAFSFANEGQGAGTWAATTPPAAHAVLVSGANFCGTALAANVVALELNIP